ncbi:Nif3-like dinuclear metal center hexameric protein [Natronoglycomyces albus]|uniref:GTP cyclohydrolase 1 type 2 homolog n=1 Tax=Natronoglycomyces albus TaxID=2811108 RepID=A0A895XTD4_9ACTN|nr:Nif3-like dinuclear metal center hexameric protein [Natronoglycomyces albus]QSB06569.1 Nif3-like dinuclear metal center hexameric protein [Natronoglycomyces albus]
MNSTVSEAAAYLNDIYPQHWAQEWDRVGLVTGRGHWPVRKALCVVDCVPETVAEAVERGANLIVAHHPLLLRGVSSLDPEESYKGDLLHSLIENRIGLYVAHTNADVANPGVSDALALRLGLGQLRPLSPLEGPEHVDSGRGIGRVGILENPMRLADFVEFAAARLPRTAWGVRATGNPDRLITTVAVSGGAGDSYLHQAHSAGADVFLTSDLRHHPVSEFLAAGQRLGQEFSNRVGEDPNRGARTPDVIDVAHYASERPWVDLVAQQLRNVIGEVVTSDVVTDPWTLHQLGS